ncbi:hypothetical protein RUND412_000486 [Rhizina undulata]
MAHGRPIRPLPKRRLRSRLSEDADASLFSPPQPPTTPLFYFPYTNYTSEDCQGSLIQSSGFGSGHHVGDNLQESSDEEDNSTASIFRGVVNGSSASAEGAAAQIDSYEWSENTNNKKKRKIPTPTNSGGVAGGNGVGGGNGGGHTSPGFSPNSTSTPRSRWKPSGSSQRSPLSTISSSNHFSLRRANRRYPASPSRDSFTRRLANGKYSTEEPATTSKVKISTTGEGSGLSAPKKTQFTFVCESPVSASLALTSPSMYNPDSSSGAAAVESTTHQKPMHTVGTQTSPNMSNTNAVYPPTPQQGKKKSVHPRSAAARREYALQQQRRRRQEAGGGNNNGEIWICEFCEYESIFGEAPEALMRQYDIKDRRERRRLAEKRRLLEKAKQKGKKNSNKNGSKKNSAASASSNSAAPPPPPPSTTDSQGTQSDNTPIASATHTPALKPQRHSQQVQTESYLDTGNQHVSSGRGASGGASGSGGGKNGSDGGGGGGGSMVSS